MFDTEDTIVALASPPGGGARAVVRVSGPEAVAVVRQCFTPADRQPLSGVRRPTAIEGSIKIEALAAPLPGVLYLWPSTRCYTRQPTAEFHTVGSPPLAEALVSEFCRLGARTAKPGEFTLRAFLAGRLDLTQAEAVLGVIDAREAAELEVALAQLAGGLAVPLAQLRGSLLDVLAQLEAGLDFAEEDIEFISREEIDRQLAAAQAQVELLLAQMHFRGETLIAVRAVLVGAPNAGKSSLYNALTGQQALVSDAAGTTRDYLAARLDLEGIVCEIVDTAGMSDSPSSGIEYAAQHTARRQQQHAEIELVCLDATQPLTQEQIESLRRPAPGHRIVVFTKCDQPRRAPTLPGAVETSSRTGAGLKALCERVRAAAAGSERPTGVVTATAARCGESLRQAASSLAEARKLASASGEELLAAELRAALHHLGEVAGEVYTDDILDRIFSRFCIGK